MRAFAYRLRKDENGATITEFAVVIPVLTAMLLGVFDIGYRQYMSAVLQGEVQKAARDTSLKGESTANSSIDARVRNRVQTVNSGATVAFDRKSVVSFDRAGRTEDFVDTIIAPATTMNGVRDPGECFTDENGNGVWDLDSGQNNGGNPEDIVKYTVTVTYQSPFPIFSILGWPSTQTLTSTTVLRNQPYADRVARTVTTICT